MHPLGGMTRLDWTAREPRKEALISSAGPAMNLAIAARPLGGLPWTLDEPGRWTDWVLVPLILSNLALGALNLVPAFPMDGGRILRALLSLKLGHLPATRVAARIGRWIAALTLVAPFLAPGFGWSFWQALVFPVVGCSSSSSARSSSSRPEAAELIRGR